MKKSLLLAINKSNPGSPRTVHSPQIESSRTIQPNLTIVREKHKELNDLVNNLSKKLTLLYNHNEKEFLSSYRVHTIELQCELKELREKVKKAEEQLNDDKVVAALESEVNWFKDEANRLSDQAERMNNDNNHLLHRIEALYEQRRYLSDQLKAIMKRSKVYEVEIESHKEINDSTSLANSKSESLIYLKTKNTNHNDNNHPYKLSSTSLNGRNILPRVPTRTSTCQRPRTSSSMQKPKLKDILVKQIEVDDDDPNDLWLALDKLNETRTSCETALEESILKTLHEEIITRKFPNHLQPINSLSVKSLELENMRTISKSHIEGITGLGLKHFTDSDKLSAVIKYLSQPEQFQEIIIRLREKYNTENN